jgi:hypothetical protein
MSDISARTFKVSIDGEEFPYAVNMAALDAIEQHYPSYMEAYRVANEGDEKAVRIIVWAGLLKPFMDADGEIDFDAAPKPSVIGKMTPGELMEAWETANEAYLASLPQHIIDAAARAAANPQSPQDEKDSTGAGGTTKRAPRSATRNVTSGEPT